MVSSLWRKWPTLVVVVRDVLLLVISCDDVWARGPSNNEADNAVRLCGRAKPARLGTIPARAVSTIFVSIFVRRLVLRRRSRRAPLSRRKGRDHDGRLLDRAPDCGDRKWSIVTLCDDSIVG